ncbi:MAG: VCBS repeat-containing protein, partial [Planctomycetaceae bacterium]|nr:VCBS repeat-containing protein [Planctomycetaceae bacterium]
MEPIRRRMTSAMTICLLCALLAGCQNNSNEGTASGQGTTSETDRGETPQQRQLTESDYRQLLVLQAKGIAHLENKEWTDAELALKQVSQLIPADIGATANLAISRVLAITDREAAITRSGNATVYAQAVQSAEDAIATLETQAKTSQYRALALLLRGKLAAFDDAPEKPRIVDAVATLRQAAELSGDQPDYWMAVALAMDAHRDYSESPQLIATLERVQQLAPENLFVLARLLERQAIASNSPTPEVQQAAGGLRATIENAATQLKPFNDTILQQRRVNLQDNIATALQKADAGDKRALFGAAMVVKNLIVAEQVVQVDKRRIDRHLLEYLQVGLSDNLPIAPEVIAAVAGPVPENLVTGFTQDSSLPDLASITSIQVVDMNLDGTDDLVLLREGRVEVWQRSKSAESEWAMLMQSEQAVSGLTDLLVADLDRDFDRRSGDLKAPAKLRDPDGDHMIVKNPDGSERWFDTDADVVAWGPDRITIFRNDLQENGERTLTLLPQSGSVSNVNDCVLADLEADGDLDLCIAHQGGLSIWRNLNGTIFEPQVDDLLGPDHSIQALDLADWNQDVSMDLVGVTTDGKSGFLQNILHGRFRWVEAADTGLAELNGATNVFVDEFNQRIGWDVVAGGPQGIQVSCVDASGFGVLQPAGITPLSDAPVTDLQVCDLDNDGRSDVVAVSNGQVLLFRCTTVPFSGKPQFADESALAAAISDVATITTADVDADGDSDLVVTTQSDGRLQLWLNQGGNINGWIDVVARPLGDDPQAQSNRVNMHSIGVTIQMRTGPVYQSHLIRHPVTHLGLGAKKTADAIRLIWTDGIPQNIVVPELLEARVGVQAPQILPTSCPYLYTWDGEQFRFFSD